MSEINLAKIKKIYFIGIGGIGISAAARILQAQGCEVWGSDAAKSEITQQLEEEGVRILLSQQADNVPADADLIVYTVAVPADNPEYRRAQELKIPLLTYPELLGALMKDKFGLGVSGTDGKTTTTAMLGQILLAAGLDPTVVVGSKLAYLGGNSRVGQSQYFLFESDEYRRAFEHYFPRLAVLTNIKADHLDCYRDLADIKDAFHQYLKKIPADGWAVINADDAGCLAAAQGIKARIISYAIKVRADFTANQLKVADGWQRFTLKKNNQELGEISLPVPAEYNIYNALGAIAAAMTLGVEFKIIQKALLEFHGAWRRFEYLGQLATAKVFTDYAHTPYALAQTIVAAKQFFPGQKILFVFQPHQYGRTKNLFNEFVVSLDQAGELIISDVFYVRGRENPADFDCDSKLLAQAVAKRGPAALYGGDLANTEKLVRERAKDFQLIMFLGAGDIYNLAKKIAS